MRTVSIPHVRLRKERYTDHNGQERERWFVRLGRRFTGTTAKKKRFSSYEAAKKWVQDEQQRKEAQGAAAFILSPTQQEQAEAAWKLLADARVETSLVDVVTYYLKRERPTGGVKDLNDAVSAYETEKKLEGVAQHYLDRQLSTVKQFARAFSKVECHEITPKACKRWLFETKSNLSQNGRRHYHSDLFAFFSWLLERRHIGVNPWADVPKPSKVATKTEILSVEQSRLLLDAALGTYLLPTVALGLFCGIRTEELKRLTWADVHLDGDEPRVMLDASITKKKRRRVIELKPVALAWLMTHRKKRGKIAPGSVEDRLTELHNALKENYPKSYRYPHNGLRHSFASYAYASFGLDWTLSALGHVGSASVFKEHYHQLVTKAEASRFWSLVPTGTGIVLPLPPQKVSSTAESLRPEDQAAG